MENSSKERQQLLRMALMGNALFSTISGLILILAGQWVVRLLGLPESVNLITMGISLLVFAVTLVVFARRKPIKVSDAWIAVVLDLAWIVGIVAEVVMLFALAQWLGIRRIRKGNMVPEPGR